MERKIAFIFHGKIRRIDQIISQIKEIFGSNYALSFLVSEHAKHSIELSTAAVKDGASYIIAVGGDGTLNEVVNGVMNAKDISLADDSNWNQITVGVLPRGNGNDFVKTVGIKYDLLQLRGLIETDSYKEIDLGRATFLDVTNKTASRYFINITDVGIGGVIADKLASSSKLFGATLSYQAVIISSLISYHNKLIKVKADSFEYQGKIMNFIVANGKFFGAGLGIAPDALPDDGQFSIVIVGDISIFDYLMNLGKVRKCVKVKHPQLKYMAAKEINIESLLEPLPIDMDGEFIGYSPLKINILPKFLKFLAPA